MKGVTASMRAVAVLGFLAGLAIPLHATDYYFSSSEGDDGNDGLSSGSPFASLATVDTLSLVAGDRVLLKCGDRWRGQQLRVNAAGGPGSLITYGSYPTGCANRPVLSGALPIVGWSVHSGSVYVADLSAGTNSGLFLLGISQLFRDEERLPCGRWPNLDAGYAFVDSVPAGNQLTDADLSQAGSPYGSLGRSSPENQDSTLATGEPWRSRHRRYHSHSQRGGDLSWRHLCRLGLLPSKPSPGPR